MKSPEEQQKPYDARKQVSESDVAYQKEKDKAQTGAEKLVFGYNQVQQYERSMRTYGNLLEDNAELRYLLETIKDKQSPEAIRCEQLIESNQKEADSQYEGRGRKLRNSFRSALENFAEVRESEGLKERSDFIFSEFKEMFSSEELQPLLQKEFGESEQEFSLGTLYERIVDGTVSDEVLYLAAKHHIALMKERQDFLDRIRIEASAEFREQTTEKVQSGFFPPIAAKRLPRATLSSVFLRDRLYDMDSQTLAHSTGFGRFTVYSDQVTKENVRKLKATLFHEMTHEFSGKVVNVRSVPVSVGSNIESAYFRKNGLVLSKPGENYSPNQWLNEAVTEWVALELSGYQGYTTAGSYKGSSSYPSERKELDRLFGRGLEKDLVLLAYFEDIQSDQASSGDGKHYARLVQRINELEGKDGFTKLEYEYIARGARDALISKRVYPEDLLRPDSKIPEGSLRCEVEVTVGVHKPRIMRTEKFICFISRGGEGVDSQEHMDIQLRSLGQTFYEIEKQFGNRIEISLETPRNHS